MKGTCCTVGKDLNIIRFTVIMIKCGLDISSFLVFAVGIATGYRLDDQGVVVGVLVRQEFSLLHVIQTGSWAYPAFYSMSTGSSFPGHKTAGA
jgi:hypothetical protein